MISEQDRERVRGATDILALVSETVELRQRGQNFWGCCPFHHEKTPSFHVNPTTGLWYCFGCHKGGDVFHYVMEREHLEFSDAIRYLADRAGIELSEERGNRRAPKRKRLLEALAAAQNYYAMLLMRGADEGSASARHYLAGRGFNSSICRSWGLGYAPGRASLVFALRKSGFTTQELLAADLAIDKNGRLQDRFFARVMFPIHDEQGRTIGFGGRVLTDAKPKYLNTKETALFHKSRQLFGLDRAKEYITASKTALVVEGYTDVIALHEHGFKNAVAALGTALSLDHIKTLSRFNVSRIVCMFDGDAAGQKAAEHSVHYVDQTNAEMCCVVLPDGQDPMEFLSSHESAELSAILAKATPLVDFVVQKKLASFDLGVPGQRISALNAVAEVLAPLRDSPFFDRYARDLAVSLGMDVEATKRVIRSKPLPVRSETEGGSRGPGLTTGTAQRSGAPWGSAPQRPGASQDASLTGMLSFDTRQQLAAEQELLSLIARKPQAVHPYEERLSQVHWADKRHEIMARAMLSKPAGTPPHELVAAASALCPEAPHILASGRLTTSARNMTDEQMAGFLVDVVELCSARREVSSIQVRLSTKANAVDTELLAKAVRLRRREIELSRKIASEV